jgi:uncharacterized protein (DUF2336 family)
LTVEDLLELIAAPPNTAVVAAVARRPNLVEPVSDAIAATADADAIRLLLANRTAAIREATLDALVARAAQHTDWHQPLVERPKLSARAAQALSDIVADQLLEVLAQRTNLDPATLTVLRQRLNERPRGQDRGTAASAAQTVDAVSATGTVTMASPAGSPPGSKPPSGRSSSGHLADGVGAETPCLVSGDALAEARTLAQAGRLTEDLLIAAAERGDASRAAAMLAVAAGVAISVVERASALRSAKGVLSLVWKAGYSMAVAGPLQSLLGKLPPKSVLPPGPGGIFPLAAEEMRWQIDFLSRTGR